MSISGWNILWYISFPKSILLPPVPYGKSHCPAIFTFYHFLKNNTSGRTKSSAALASVLNLYGRRCPGMNTINFCNKNTAPTFHGAANWKECFNDPKSNRTTPYPNVRSRTARGTLALVSLHTTGQADHHPRQPRWGQDHPRIMARRHVQPWTGTPRNGLKYAHQHSLPNCRGRPGRHNQATPHDRQRWPQPHHLHRRSRALPFPFRRAHRESGQSYQRQADDPRPAPRLS